jgi:S-adenosyl methyltransferase
MDRAQFRTLDQMRALLGGLELTEPGLAPVAAWCPELPAAGLNAGAGHQSWRWPAPVSSTISQEI